MEEQKDKIKETDNERIDAFLRNQLSPEERKAFLEELAANEELRQRAAAMALLVKSMHKIGRENDAKIIQEVRQTQSSQKSVKFSLYVKRTLAIAACLCLIFTAYDYQDAKTATDQLATQCLNTYQPNLPTADDLARAPVTDAVKARELQVLSELTTLFDVVTKGTDNDQCIQDLKAKYKLASSDTYNEYIAYYKQIGYYLAVAYLKDNDRKSAKAILKEVLTNEPDFMEAKQLLEEIENIHFIFE